MLSLYCKLMATSSNTKNIAQNKLKAAGMLEYALIAIVSVAAFALIYIFFPNFIQGLWDKLTNSIQGVTG